MSGESGADENDLDDEEKAEGEDVADADADADDDGDDDGDDGEGPPVDWADLRAVFWSTENRAIRMSVLTSARRKLFIGARFGLYTIC